MRLQGRNASSVDMDFSVSLAPTTKGLRRWVVYADLVDGEWIYAGSATAGKKSRYKSTRISTSRES